ncbi:MAG: protein-export chaperone SecB [Sphaerochaetaceae bacterium]
MNSIKIQDISISSLSYSCHKRKLQEGQEAKKPIYYQFSIDDSHAEINVEKDRIFILFPLVFQIAHDFPKEGKTELLVKLSAKYALCFESIENITEIPASVKKEFLGSYIPRIIHPYFRQLITDSLGKMGLPPMQLPLYENIKEKES